MKRFLYVHSVLLFLLTLTGCMDYEPERTTRLSLNSLNTPGVYIVSEGGFMYGNASLEYYSRNTRSVMADVFSQANARALGDVAQSMTLYRGLGYVVVNNSGVVYIIDPSSSRLVGGIRGFSSPRYVHFVSDTKAYVSDLVASQLYIVDPIKREITGRIPTPGHMSTERMVQVGSQLWVSCWSYDRTLLIIDTETDTILEELRVGIQPTALELDSQGMLWVLSTGGYPGSTYGYEAPTLRRIDPTSRTVLKTFTFPQGKQLGAMSMSPDRTFLYYLLDGAVYSLPIGARQLPSIALVPAPRETQSKPYGLGVDPQTGDIYMADAIDYVQAGVVYRYDHMGIPLDTFRVGINPSSFCFVP